MAVWNKESMGSNAVTISNDMLAALTDESSYARPEITGGAWLTSIAHHEGDGTVFATSQEMWEPFWSTSTPAPSAPQVP